MTKSAAGTGTKRPHASLRDVSSSELIARNKLDSRARLKPGMVLRIDADDAPAAAAAGP